MASKMLLIAACCILLSFCTASRVPVLMWSPSRPLSDLPQVSSGSHVDGQTFQDKYLSPVTSGKDNNLVVFLQDKLNVNDFAKYADVYNPDSNGGAFKNVKGFMDEHFSVDLPAVTGAHSVLNNCMKNFKGMVHKVKSSEEVAGLDLGSGQKFLILVLLPSTGSAKSEESAHAQNDKIIGEVVHQLNKRGMKYTALYTGETAEKKSVSEAHTGRHLLATETATASNNTYLFVNLSSNLFLFARGVTVQLYTTDKNNQQTNLQTLVLPTVEGKYQYNNSVWGNDTATVEVSFPRVETNSSSSQLAFSVSFKFTAYKMLNKDWALANFTLTVVNDTSSERVLNNLPLDTVQANIMIPKPFSYSCSNQVFSPPLGVNSSIEGHLIFQSFQFQPFYIKEDQFSESWDCIGFFSTPIWMGLFPIAIITILLYVGLYMMAGLSTMDRFDDPKGKTISVNVAE